VVEKKSLQPPQVLAWLSYVPVESVEEPGGKAIVSAKNNE